MRLNGKVAIITGAGSGMGAEEARLFAAEGARLVLTDVNELAVQSVARDLEPNVRLWSDRLRPPVGTLGAP